MRVDLANLYPKRETESHSLSAENCRGEQGKGDMETPDIAPVVYWDHPLSTAPFSDYPERDLREII